MENKQQNMTLTIVGIVLSVVLMIVSFFVIAPKLEKVETYKGITQSLDDKRTSVVEISGALVGLSVAVAAVPGDSTTPIASEVAQLNSYLVMALGAVMLEKFLLPIMGTITWRILIPIAGLLLALYFGFRKQALLGVSIRIAVLAIAFFGLIPAGVLVGDIVDASFGTENLIERVKTEIEEIDEDAEELEEADAASEAQSDQNSESSFWDSLFEEGLAAIDDVVNSGASLMEKAKVIIGEIMDAVAALVVSSCVIPIGILIIFVAIIKALFSAVTRLIPVFREE